MTAPFQHAETPFIALSASGAYLIMQLASMSQHRILNCLNLFGQHKNATASNPARFELQRCFQNTMDQFSSQKNKITPQRSGCDFGRSCDGMSERRLLQKVASNDMQSAATMANFPHLKYHFRNL